MNGVAPAPGPSLLARALSTFFQLNRDLSFLPRVTFLELMHVCAVERLAHKGKLKGIRNRVPAGHSSSTDGSGGWI